jgi:ferric-dicitrate binding protein FerR (iron transport regulator)
MMDKPNREEWEAQELPSDFADRVMARVDAETPVRARRSYGRFVIAGALAAAAAAAFVGVRAMLPPARGDVVASSREQVSLGPRAIAVLERGAHLVWRGDVVEQSAGDVFYRVEPGGAYRVKTPAGDVEVLGTCFRVAVTGSEVVVNGRDFKAGAIGAALGMVALVSVYEGKVAVSHASDRVTLSPGEKARADRNGVHREGSVDGASSSQASDERPPIREDEPLLAANANLADSVREYRRRLETIEAQKQAAEKLLAEAQQKLEVAQKGGAAGPERSKFDLDQDDWKQLAKDGTVRARYPCLRPNPKEGGVSPDSLQKAGLKPEDGPIIQKAYDASRARIWATIRPLCVSAMQGDEKMADKLGPSTCESLVRDVAAANGTDVGEDMRAVAEIRAGMRAVPADGGDPVVKMMMALTGETTAVVSDLTQSLGPEDAKRLVYGEDGPGCWNNSQWGVGPRPPASAQP